MKTLGWLSIAFLSFAIAILAIAIYTLQPMGANLPEAMRLSFLSHKSIVYTHIFASATALLLGPLQLLPILRYHFPCIHRLAGRVYLGIGVLFGGLSGLYMAAHAYGGIVSKAGFTGLALMWLYTGLRAFLSIRQGRVAEHRQWVLRNFSLTFAAVMLRLYLPAAGLSGIPFDQSYPVIAWICWAPNLIFVELVFNRRRASSAPRMPRRLDSERFGASEQV
ncbi:DUF2306 domain-containing protein [Arenimonas sp.]|uniref:DUF2306 domain-containing protein n=1 Tax=Arenimonas sp. TaxID=1872635 RepID=UPI0039E57C73